MFCKINSFGVRGVEGYGVLVEADVSDGLPCFTMVGYLSQETREAEQRVRTSLRNAGFAMPPKKVTVNLSPADIRKEGTAFDLAIGAAVLGCLGHVRTEGIESSAFAGELGLNGEIKPVKGILSRVYAAVEQGITRFFLPADNVSEGTAVKGIEIVGVRDLKELADLMNHRHRIKGRYFDSRLFEERMSRLPEIDFSDICGQETVKRACQVAAAGMHNILLIGPAGTGKTMAARRIPTILPPLTLEESIFVSKIYSICGLLPKDQPLLTSRPFRKPHHGITFSALAGGGSNPKPGEISLASKGILFLDELPEFPVRILDMLRQPMEEHSITVSRLNSTVSFPADMMVAAAMNPCKCGYYPDPGRCTCTDAQVRSYLSRVSGPFIDRMDIGVEVPPVPYEALEAGEGKKKKGLCSAQLRDGVMAAREIQRRRFQDSSTVFNGQMEKREILQHCGLDREDTAFLKRVYKTYGFSARAHDKILKTARTIADLDGKEQIDRIHLSEAITYRSFEKKYWGYRA